MTILREGQIDQAVRNQITRLRLAPQEETVLDEILAQKRAKQQQDLERGVASLRLNVSAIADRQNRLTDAYLDGVLAREEYEQRKTALITERCDIEDKLRSAERGESSSLADLEFYVELVKRAYLQYEHGLDDEKRDLLKDATSNRLADGKTIEITWKFPLSAIANRPTCPSGGPHRDKARTFWLDWLKLFAMTERKRSPAQTL